MGTRSFTKFLEISHLGTIPENRWREFTFGIGRRKNGPVKRENGCELTLALHLVTQRKSPGISPIHYKHLVPYLETFEINTVNAAP